MQISVDMCLSGRDLTEPKLCPDGGTIAFVSRWAGSTAIVTVPTDGGPERIVTTAPQPAPGRGLGGGCFDWLPDGSGLVYAARDGNLWRQPIPGGPALRLTDVDEHTALEAPVVTRRGDAVVAVLDQASVWWYPLAAHVDRDAAPDDPDDPVDPVDPVGPRRLDDGSADFCLDPAVSACGSTVRWSAWSVPDMAWDGAFVGVHDLKSGEITRDVGPASIQQPGSLPDGRTISVRDDAGWLNVHVGDQPLVAEACEHAGPTWGPGQRTYASSPDGRRVAFTRNERGFGRLCVAAVPATDDPDDADGRAAGGPDQIARGVHGQLSWRGDRLAALRTGARTPTQIVSYDTTTWERRVLALGPVAGWEQIDLPEPDLVETTADDGATIHARRYDAGTDRTICWIHGGPTDQWQVEFMPRVAYWCSRGWNVLVPDPRGSTGHGRDYQQALRGRWGELDVSDTAAVLAGSHARQWSSPELTVMMGGSSGGLTALGVLGRHRGLAGGGVVLYPVTDLRILATASHRYEAHYNLSLVGPVDDDERHLELSATSHADQIDVPLLVMHGDCDAVVPLASTVEFVDQIRAAGHHDVELVVYEGEGHGFRDPANKRDEYTRVGAFLERIAGAAG